MSDKQAKVPTTPAPIVIRPVLRVLLALAGLGSGVIGYFAIMRADTPEVGGVAFVALAGLFVVLAVIGRIPQKVTAGNMGVEFGDAAKIVQAAEELPPDSRTEFAERLRERSDQNATYRFASETILAGADFERAVVALLEAKGWLDADFTGIARTQDSSIDAVVRFGNKRIAVTIKLLRQVDVLSESAARVSLAARDAGLYDAVIIVPDGGPKSLGVVLVINGVKVVPFSRINDLPGMFE